MPSAAGLHLALVDPPARGPPPVPLVPGEITLLEMGPGWSDVRQRLLVQTVAGGGLVYHLVAGARLDSAGLSERALAHGVDPADALGGSLVAYAPTAQALARLAHETVPAVLARKPDVKAVVVVDPLRAMGGDGSELGHDNDGRQPREAPERCAGHAGATARLARSLANLRAAATRAGCPVLVVQPPLPHAPPAPSGSRRQPGPLTPYDALVGACQARVRVSDAQDDGTRRVHHHDAQGRVHEHVLACTPARQARLEHFTPSPGGAAGHGPVGGRPGAPGRPIAWAVRAGGLALV